MDAKILKARVEAQKALTARQTENTQIVANEKVEDPRFDETLNDLLESQSLYRLSKFYR